MDAVEVLELAFPKKSARMIATVFEAMRWVEEEIEEARQRHPDKTDVIWDCFMLCCPTDPLQMIENLVRAHARQIIDRVIEGSDTRLPTPAEMCGALSLMSQAAPLTSDATQLYAENFVACFEKLPDGAEAAISSGQEYFVDELRRSLEKKLTVKERKLP